MTIEYIITKGLDWVVLTAFLFAMMASPFACACLWIRYRRKRQNAPTPNKVRWVIFAWVGSIAFTLVGSEVIDFAGRIEIENFIDTFQDGQIVVNEEVAPNKILIVEALKNLKWKPAHHTHTLANYYVDFTSPCGNLELLLSRDSHNPHEYWVFYPKYFLSTATEVGKIETTSLDGLRQYRD